MRRVSRPSCEDGPLLEEQETEGQRQLHSLLLQQLHTDVQIERCVAKKQCFAPAALYRPFGEQAAGVRSLLQFQALQDGEKELVRLRELGLTEPEIQLWLSRDEPDDARKSHGVRAAPGAREQRLQVIRDKMDARAELLARPQRFAASRPLSRREMEIEQALFQGSDRRGFLTALYHRDEESPESQQGAPPSDPMGHIYRDVLSREQPGRPAAAGSLPEDAASDQSQGSERDGSQSEDATDTPRPERGGAPTDASQPMGGAPIDASRPIGGAPIDASRPIGSLRPVGAAARAGPGGPLTVRGRVETLTDEEILQNRATEDEIRNVPRFRNYQPGEPSKVLCVKNLSAQASVAQLVALFSRFQQQGGAPVLYRLLTGRMKGQAFVTLPDAQTAHDALRLVHGYRLLGKPLVVEFGRERHEVEKRKETEVQEETQ
ncbi:RNA-binding protein 41 [Salarias fasciatus]|uniref:RNA-binding protein 41 n=1 Tax=Salarias fasciatus TaxID=181472 RepID=UPI001176F95F|nr:RNA-binding protein 41 [Salarias fasciatus]